MRFAENNRISHRQLYRQMILEFLAPFILCMYGAGKLNGINALMGMAMALIPLGFYVIVLIRMTPVFENLKKSGGVLVGRLTGLFFIVFVLMAGGYILAVLGQLVPVSLITGMSEEWITFWAVLVCMTGIRGGMPGRGRMAQISGGVLLGGMILMMILCIPQGKAEYLHDMAAAWKFSGQEIFEGFYGTICAFSAVGLLPFLLGNVEKYASAGKTVLAGILTLGGILMGMAVLLPAVLGYGRVVQEKYPVLPLLDGADLPGNVLARFDVLWMGFLLYSLLFALGSLLHYSRQIAEGAGLGWGKVWTVVTAALIWCIARTGKWILESFGWYLGYIFVPGLLICQIFLFLRSKKRHRKKGVIISGVLICSIMLGGCAGAVEPEKRMYALALGVDASEDGLLVSYGMPDLPESTGQGKEEENGSTRVLEIRGENFTQIEEAYDRSQEKFRDLGHLQVLVLGKLLLEDGRWELVLDYLKQEAFVGEDLYVFQAENASQVLNWQGQDNSSLGEYVTGLIENRMSGRRVHTVTLRQVFYEKYKSHTMPKLPEITVTDSSLEISV